MDQRKSGEILKTIPLSDRPNNLAITKDGSQVLVGIRRQPGVLDVIDTTSLQKIKSIPVDGAVRNVREPRRLICRSVVRSRTKPPA